MTTLNENSIVKFSEPTLAHEENFELTIKVKQGQKITRTNYSSAVSLLQERLNRGQHDENSNILSFDISKVIRDENNEIIESTLIVTSKVTAFDEAKKTSGSVFIDGIEYALMQDAYISDDGKTYQAAAFSRDMMDEDQKHQGGLDDSVTVYWGVDSDGECGEFEGL